MTAARGRKKRASGVLSGQAEDVWSMLLFATGFKRPRTGKKHKAAALRCLWRIIVKGAVAKVSAGRLRAYGGHIGIWAYAARVGVWRTAAGGGECMGGECMGGGHTGA